MIRQIRPSAAIKKEVTQYCGIQQKNSYLCGMTLRIGIVGVGHLGYIHLKIWQQLPDVSVVGFYDPDNQAALRAQTELNATRFPHIDDLLQAVDAIDIVCSTAAHAQHALRAIAAQKHIFIEKPLAGNLADAQLVVDALRQTRLKGQVGHVERFNPAFKAIQHLTTNPRFIESHRLAPFNLRGTDVSVVHDLMIHDLDIIAGLVQSPVKQVAANGVAIVSTSPDIANARIEFENGCVANITASRLSLKYMRKTRIFQPDAYISIDFLAKKADIARLMPTLPPDAPNALSIVLPKQPDTTQYIVFEQPEAPENNAIAEELTLFVQAILNDQPEAVPLEYGLRAMQLADSVMNCIDKQQGH